MAINQTLQHKRSTISGNVPSTSQVAIGELAINLGDKSIYTKTPGGVIIELAADVLTGPVFLGNPNIGDLWYNTNNESLQAWDGVQWVNAASTGKSVLPNKTTSSAGFSSGSGTALSPYIYSTNAGAGDILFIDTITVLDLTPGQYVPITDLNQSVNGGRFSVDNYFANQAGTLIFTITYTDLPASTLGTVHTAAFKIGSGSVYFNAAVTVGVPFSNPINHPTDTLPVTTPWISGSDTLNSSGDLLISLNGGTYGTGPMFITPGSTLYIKWAGSAGSGTGIDGVNGTTITGSVYGSSGGVSTASLTIDKTPQAFTFTSQTGVALNATVASNIVTVTGVNSYVYLTSSNTMSASIANGAYVNVPSTGTSMSIISGQSLQVAQSSSSLINTPTSVSLNVSGSNVSFQVTTGNNIVNTPSITVPTSGATGVVLDSVIVANDYSVTGIVGTHLNSDWQIYSDAALTVLVTSSMASTTNLTTWTPSGLNYNTQYWVRVRYRSNDSTPAASEWSPSVSWTTVARIVNTPGITTPVNGSVDIFPNSTITSSPYSFSGPVGTHLNSDWQIYSDEALTVLVTSSLASTTNLTTWTPSGLLGQTQYWVRVRYRSDDSVAVVSEWSPAITWTTIALTVVTPSITYPVNGSTSAYSDSVIVASVYNVTGPVGTHHGSDWEIYNNASLIGPTVTQSLGDTVNLTTWQPSGLVAQTQYWVRVRYTSSDSINSEWCTPITWIPASQPGASWTFRSQLATTGFGSAAIADLEWTGTQYLVIGAVKAATSTDGVTWVNQTGISAAGSAGLNAVSWNGTQYLVVGNDSIVATSLNGSSWTYQPGINSLVTSGTANILGITWNGSKYLAVGAFSKSGIQPSIFTSLNGVAWTRVTSLSSTGWTSSGQVNDSVWNGTMFLIIGPDGKIATSSDGSVWDYQNGLRTTAWGTAADVLSVAWNGTQFIVGGESGKIATSPDGIIWTNQSGLSSTLWGTDSVKTITWNGTQYLALGTNGKAATSPNGITWTNQTGLSSTSWGATSSVNASLWNGSSYIVVGDSGKVATSP